MPASRRNTWLRFFSKALVISGFALSFQSLPAMAAPVVSKLEADRSGGVETLILTVSQAVSYDDFLLDNPHRLVLDFPTLDWRVPQSLPKGYKGLALKSLRVGTFNPTTTRVVLDLHKPVKLLGVTVDNAGDGTVEIAFSIGETGAKRASANPRAAASPNGVLSLPPRLQRKTSGADFVAEQFTPPSQSKVMTGDEIPIPEPAPRQKRQPEPEAEPEPEPQSVPDAPIAAAPAPAADWATLVEEAASASDGKILSRTELAALGFTEAPIPVLKSGESEKATPRRKPMIVIDAGHGGQDPGATGVSGIKEKRITLEYAKALRDALLATGRFEVTLTRTDDTYIMLRERLALGRKAKGDLFISLHADSAPDGSTRGLSLYTLSDTASDKEAAGLAQRENKVDLIFGMNLSHEEKDVTEILIDLAQRETNNKSQKLAAHLVAALKKHVQLLQNTHRHAGFAVLKAPDVPSVLIELGFLSNRKDEALIKSSNYRERMLKGIVQGIDSYFAAQKFW